ncbi:MAG TPA: UbiA family prenyltransferase [Acidisarcina sp.]
MRPLPIKDASTHPPLEKTEIQVAHRPIAARLRAHYKIARIDHSIKNVFVLPGILVPLSILRPGFDRGLMIRIATGLVSTTLIACSNYVINEVLDAPFDRLHPIKKNRPTAQHLVSIPWAYVQWISMMLAGMALALTVSRPFAYAAAGLWMMGCLYNIPPFRFKEVAYLDVLAESINNPLRMLLGWFMVTAVLIPPASLLLSYWMIGCFFMALKRFSEYRDLESELVAGSYRKSFKTYTERSLLRSVLFYASVSMLFFGTFIMRYRIELILSFPFIAVMMATYFDLAFRSNSAVQHPEKLYKQRLLMAETAVTAVVIVILLFVDLPWIARIFAPTLPLAAR